MAQVETNDERNDKASGGDDNGELHQLALKRADDTYNAELYNLQNGREAQRFYAGEQWPDADKLARERENRPVVVINRMPAFVRQVTGDVRKDTPVPKFMPAKDGASQEVADILNGLYRNIDQQSNAKAAYVKAVENACQAGIGWIEVVTEYSSDDGFEQDIRIKRRSDPFQVLVDPGAQEPDKSDMQFAFVLDDMPDEMFKKTYPDATLDPFPSPATNGMVWKTEKTIRIAEYWYRKPVTKTLYLMPDGSVTEKPQPPLQPVNQRTVKVDEIWQCIMSGKEVLRDPQKWAGKYIPLVPVIGEELRLDGRTVRKGMVHDAIGPQQVLNYAVTAQAEQAGKAPKAPIAVSKTQIAGYENDWATAGSSNASHLVYSPDPNAPGPPKRMDPVPTNPGLSELVIQSAAHLKDITGIHDASLGAPSNETSGRAIMARQREGDTGTYLYIDNLATALRQVGLIILDLIPKIYDTERVVRVLKEDGTHDMATVNQEVEASDPETGLAVTKVLNDLSIGEYDVTVITGPSFATRRQEAAQSVTELVRSAPELMGIAGDIIIRNLDFPGADEIAKRLEAKMNGGPSPTDVADARLKLAQADEAEAKAEGEQIANITSGVQVLQMLQTMQTTMQAIQQQLQAGLSPQPAQSLADAAANGDPNASMALRATAPPPPETQGGDVVDMPPPAAPQLEPLITA